MLTDLIQRRLFRNKFSIPKLETFLSTRRDGARMRRKRVRAVEPDMPTARSLLFEALEPRVLMSADLDPMASTALSGATALTVLTMTPVLAFYPYFQKYFVKGLTLGAVKG